MTDRTPEEPRRSDPGITERTAEGYREALTSELEAEIERLRQRADALQRSLDERTSELRAFGAIAQAVQGAHRVLREPSLLARVPQAALRAIRGGGRASPAAERRLATPAPASRLPAAASSRPISAPRDVCSLKVALIADEGLALALEPECRTIRLTPNGWQQALASDRPDLLVVESAWRASRGAWQYRLAWYGHPLSIQLGDLRAITDRCAAGGIPTIFWETTGPAHRGRFDEVAALFDVILTSDPAGLAHYESLPGRRAAIVDLLEPGVQFRRYHPPPAGPLAAELPPTEATGRPIFVGGYDPARPLADREALDRLLDAGLQRGLRIYDTSGVSGPDGARFPERFRPAVHEVTSLDRLPDLLRSAGVVLVDAQAGDGELLVDGLLDALACGAPVVATPSGAIRTRFGGGVPGAAPDDDPGIAIDRILAAPADARRRIRAGVLPLIARDFDIRSRLSRLAAAADIRTVPTAATIALAVLHDDPGRTAALADALAGLGDVTEILVGTSDWAGAGAGLAAALRSARPNVPVRVAEHSPEAPGARRLERLAAITDVDWIAPWTDGAGSAERDPLDGLRLAIAFEPADVVFTDDARLPRAVRRRSVLAAGWPADRPADAGPGLVAVAGPAR